MVMAGYFVISETKLDKVLPFTAILSNPFRTWNASAPLRNSRSTHQYFDNLHEARCPISIPWQTMGLPNPAAITLADGASEFTLKPIIRELVRTSCPIPGSIFLVEDVQIVPCTNSSRRQAIRLLLGDGKLCIQALLRGEMHWLVHSREIFVGSYVLADDIEIRFKTTESGGVSKDMVYLKVNDLKTIGWNNDVCKMQAAQQGTDGAHDGGTEVHIGKGESPMPASTLVKSRSAASPDLRQVQSSRKQDKCDDGQDDDFENGLEDDELEKAFEYLEARKFPVRQSQKSPSKQSGNSSKKHPLPIVLPRDWHDPQTPLQLTTLGALPELRQNCSCNILAIVASISPVEQSNVLPYKQRTARIADPYTAKQVHLTVFLNPDEFTPKVGSAVLLTGVKKHRFDGGSLKKYASGEGHGKWWFEDPWDLTWCDVKGIKEWWAGMEAFFASPSQEEAAE